MKIHTLFAAVLGTFAAMSNAATVTVTVDGTAANYTLQSLSVDASGNVKVFAAGGGNAGGGNDGGNTGGGNDGGNTGGGNDGGNTGGGNDGGNTGTGTCTDTETLKCFATGVGDKAGVVFTNGGGLRPAPAEIQAYAFKTPTGSGKYAGSAVATRMTGAYGKRMVISAVAGDMNTDGKDAGCFTSGAEVTSRSYAVNNPSLHKVLYCHLQPGQTYYVNVAPIVDGNGKANCTTANSCGYTFTLK